MPHFVLDPDNVVLSVSGRACGVGGIGYSSLVLEVPLALRQGRVGACTAGTVSTITGLFVCRLILSSNPSHVATLTLWDHVLGY